jgi:hypothetical protein
MRKPQVKRHLIIKSINKEDRTIDVCATGIMESYLMNYCTPALDGDTPLADGATSRIRVDEVFEFGDVYDHLLELEFDKEAADEVVAETEEYHRRMAEELLRRRGGRIGPSPDDGKHPF